MKTSIGPRIVSLLLLSSFTIPAVADTSTWSGGGVNGDWNDAGNWDTIPASGDTLIFVGESSITTTNDLLANGTSIAGIQFTNDGSSGMAGNFTLQNGDAGFESLNLDGNITTTAIATGGMALEDDIQLDLVLDADRDIHTKTGHDLKISGDISGGFTLIIGDNNATNDEGLVTLSGNNTHSITQIDRNGRLRVESNDALGGQLVMDNGTATLLIADGLTLNPTNGIVITNEVRPKRIQLADEGTTAAEIASTVSFNAGNNKGNRRFEIITGDNDTLTISGQLTSSTENTWKRIEKEGNGTLILSNSNNDFEGVFRVDAGTLELQHSHALQKARVDPSGGTIVFDDNVDVANAATFGSLRDSGDLTLETDTEGALALTIAGLVNDSYSGVISDNGSGGGSLIKNGSSTQTLSGNNTYTGTTTVNAGRLDLEGTNTSAITVANGATLGGDAGSTSAGITFLTGSTVGINNKGSASALAVTGASTLDTTAGGINILLDEGRNTAGETINLFDVTTGSWTGSGANFNKLSRDSIANNAGIIQLTAAAAQTATWSGAAGNTWDLDNTASWNTTGEAVDDSLFITGDSVIFTDTAAGTVTVNDANGAIIAENVTFSNTTGNDYTVAQFDSEILTVNGDLDITGSGNVTLNTGLNIGGTLDTTGSTGNVIIGDVIEGGSAIDHGGSGTLFLNNAANSQTGGTIVRSGATLDVGANGALGASTNVTTVEDGGTIIFRSIQTAGDANTTLVEGAGVGGLGAIRKVAGGNGDFADLRFTGNTTISVEQGRFELVTPSFANPNTVITKRGGSQLRIDANLSDATNLDGWVLEAGLLTVGNANALTSTTQTVTINGGTLYTFGDKTVNTAITMNGGTLRADGNNATATYNGNITVNSASTWRADTNSGTDASTLAIASALTGAGNITTNQNGTIDLLAAFDGSGYTGTLNQVTAGTVRINADETINSLAATVAGATFDLQGNTLTTGDTGSTAYLGDITGAGGLTKVGAGTFDISGASTYSGTTSVNAGTLAVSGSIASAATVSSGATLDFSGTGSTGAITINDGATLTGEGSTSGALTLGDGGGGGAILSVDASTESAAFTTTGALTTTANATTVNISAGPTGAGDITILNHDGTYAGVVTTDFILGTGLITSGRAGAGTFANAAGVITLSTGFLSNTWVGSDLNGGIWETGGTGANWTNDGTDTVYQDGDFVTFDDTGTNAGTVVIDGGNVAPSTITFSAAGGTSYTIDAAASETLSVGAGGLNFFGDHADDDVTINAEIVGSGTITKGQATAGVANVGQTIISHDNSSFTGVTLIRQGDLTISDVNALGNDSTNTITMEDRGDDPVLTITDGGTMNNNFVISNVGKNKYIKVQAPENGNLTLAGDIAINETNNYQFNLEVDGGDTMTITGNISGGGGFRKRRGGTLVLDNVNNSFSQAVIATRGTIQAASVADIGSNSAIGSGTSGPGIRLGDTGSKNSGTFEYTGATAETDRQVQIGYLARTDSGDTSAGTIKNSGTGTLTFDNTNFNNITATRDITAARTITFDSDTTNGGGDIVVTGKIVDNDTANGGTVAVTKIGNGALTLGGDNTYTGNTTVDGGTLLINGDHSGATGTVNVTTGTLGGNGTVGGATTINANANHFAGSTTTAGAVAQQTFGSDLTYSGGMVSWDLNSNSTANPGTNYDQFVIGGNLSFPGTTNLSLNFNGDSGSGSTVDWDDTFWNADQSWIIYDVAGTLNGVPTLVNEEWQDASGDTFSANVGSFALNSSGSDIVLTFTTVPEPSTYALMGLGLAALGWARRSRKRDAVEQG